MTEAIGYMRTSSASGVGDDKDSEKRQRAAIEGFASERGFEIVDWFYDADVRGVIPVTERPGFKAMMERIAGNGVRTIIVESPDRFARDLIVQLTGHDYLKGHGIALIPASAPDFFTEETPTAVLVRQVLGAIAQFEKANLVAKLKAAQDRIKAEKGKCSGRKNYAEMRPEVVGAVWSLRQQGKSFRVISAELAAHGHLTSAGKPYAPAAVRSMLQSDVAIGRILARA